MINTEKKPVVIEAVQYTQKNLKEIEEFAGECLLAIRCASKTKLCIHTLEGDMELTNGDYIIKGVNEEFYPCKPEIFEKTYEKVFDKTTPKDLQ